MYRYLKYTLKSWFFNLSFFEQIFAPMTKELKSHSPSICQTIKVFGQKKYDQKPKLIFSCPLMLPHSTGIFHLITFTELDFVAWWGICSLLRGTDRDAYANKIVLTKICLQPFDNTKTILRISSTSVQCRYESQVSHKAGTYPGFCRMKQLGVFLLTPGWDANYPKQ